MKSLWRKLDILRRDALWADYSLGLSRDNIRVVPAERLFETSDLPR